MSGPTKKLLIFAAAMAGVAAFGWFGRKAYKGALEHRFLVQAEQFSRTNDFRDAELCLRRVLQVNPASVTAARMVADMLETAGLPSATVTPFEPDFSATAVDSPPPNCTTKVSAPCFRT